MIDRNKTFDLMREAKFNSEDHYAIVEMLLHFANLVAAEVGIAQYQRGYEEGKAFEREACANIVENANTPDCGGWTAQGIADTIRARGNND